MGWSHGTDPDTGREIGYGVSAKCDHPACTEQIDLGLGYRCGHFRDDPGGPEGCGGYFCGDHLQPMAAHDCPWGECAVVAEELFDDELEIIRVSHSEATNRIYEHVTAKLAEQTHPALVAIREYTRIFLEREALYEKGGCLHEAHVQATERLVEAECELRRVGKELL